MPDRWTAETIPPELVAIHDAPGGTSLRGLADILNRYDELRTVGAALDPWTTPGTPNATRYVCPLGDWYHDEPKGEPFGGVVGYEARAERNEALIRQHFEERHTLEDWVRAATQLANAQRVVQALADWPSPAPERVHDALCTGSLTINDARWIQQACIALAALKAEK